VVLAKTKHHFINYNKKKKQKLFKKLSKALQDAIFLYCDVSINKYLLELTFSSREILGEYKIKNNKKGHRAFCYKKK
jgi:hypothetical protein